MSGCEAIERLRAAVAAAPKEVRITLPQVQAVTAGLTACDSLTDISRASGLPEPAVLDLVAEFGTWLTHVRGGSGAVTKTAASMDQLPLLQLPLETPPPAKKSAAKKSAAKKSAASTDTDKKASKKAPAKKAAAKNAANPPVVIVPYGFERGAPHGRDVSKALASIVVANPDAEVMTRFLSRKYRATVQTLTYRLMVNVWQFATLGVIDEIDQLGEQSLSLGAVVVAAYDTIELARTEAIAALATLCTPGSSSLEELADAAMRCRWVAEGDVTRLERHIAIAASNPASRRLLDPELARFADMVRANPRRFVVGSIAELNSAQLRRIAEAAGIDTSAPDTRLEGEIRRRLQGMGLSADVDRYVPDGMRAHAAGAGPVFWDAMERRVEGDPDWDLALREALSAPVTA